MTESSDAKKNVKKISAPYSKLESERPLPPYSFYLPTRSYTYIGGKLRVDVNRWTTVCNESFSLSKDDRVLHFLPLCENEDVINSITKDSLWERQSWHHRDVKAWEDYVIVNAVR